MKKLLNRLSQIIARRFGAALPADPEDQRGLRAIIEHAYDAFIGMNEKGVIIEWNLKAEEVFGWNREQALGHLLGDLIVPQRFRIAHQKGLEHYLKTGEGPVLGKKIEVPAIHRSGREISIELTIYPIRQGRELIFGSYSQDISDRKRLAALHNVEFSVTAILAESSLISVAMPKVLKTFCEELGWPLGEFWLPQREDSQTHIILEQAWPQSEASEGFSRLSLKFAKSEGLPGQVWASGEPLWIENLDESPYFTRRVEALSAQVKCALAFPVKNGAGKTIAVMAFFTSSPVLWDERFMELVSHVGNRVGLFIERKQAKEELAQLYAQSEQIVQERTRDLTLAYEKAQIANRLKDEFLATVSHELRTPLGVIQGHTQLLMDGDYTSEELQSSLETILRNARAQGQIINDLLDVSRIITGKLNLDIQSVDLNESVALAIESTKVAALAKGIQLIVDSPEKLGPVRGDQNRIQQVLWNLLSNAVKFTPKDGKISVRLSRVDSRARIEVSDTGKGIDPEFLPHVFERFRQEDASTTRRYGGLGLGLAIVRHIVESHGGTVSVASPGLNCGSTFTVELPLAAYYKLPQELQKVSTPLSEAQAASETKKIFSDVRILAVDDQVDTRNLLDLILRRHGADVRTASSVNEGMHIFEDFKPHILISDISMPGQDGISFIRQIRARSFAQGGQIPAIALTAHAHQWEKGAILNAGFQRHIAKPFETENLIEELRQLLAQTP